LKGSSNLTFLRKTSSEITNQKVVNSKAKYSKQIMLVKTLKLLQLILQKPYESLSQDAKRNFSGLNGTGKNFMKKFQLLI